MLRSCTMDDRTEEDPQRMHNAVENGKEAVGKYRNCKELEKYAEAEEIEQECNAIVKKINAYLKRCEAQLPLEKKHMNKTKENHQRHIIMGNIIKQLCDILNDKETHPGIKLQNLSIALSDKTTRDAFNSYPNKTIKAISETVRKLISPIGISLPKQPKQNLLEKAITSFKPKQKQRNSDAKQPTNGVKLEKNWILTGEPGEKEETINISSIPKVGPGR